MKIIKNVFKYGFLSFLALVILFPLIYTVAGSFKTNMEIMAYPELIFSREPSWDNYKTIFAEKNFNFGKMLFNSVWYTATSVCITLVLSTLLGYVFARGEFRGKTIIFGLFAALMFVSMGTITMYPYFEVLNFLNIPRGLPALLVIKCFGMPIANVYLVRGYIMGIPYEIDEAARVDGCTFLQIFRKIIIFILKPITATIALLSFKASWNDYMMPMLFTLTKPEQRPLIVAIVSLKSSGGAAASWNLMLAGAALSIVPVLIVYIFFNKYFVDGIAAGAVKG